MWSATFSSGVLSGDATTDRSRTFVRQIGAEVARAGDAKPLLNWLCQEGDELGGVGHGEEETRYVLPGGEKPTKSWADVESCVSASLSSWLRVA